MGTSTIHLCSIKSFLPSLYLLRHSHDKLFQALYHFSVLQVTETWAGPWNETIVEPLSGKLFLMGKFQMQIIITAKVFRSAVELLLTSNTMATCQYSQTWWGQILFALTLSSLRLLQNCLQIQIKRTLEACTSRRSINHSKHCTNITLKNMNRLHNLGSQIVIFKYS